MGIILFNLFYISIMSEGSGSPKSTGNVSLTSTMMTPKQYLLVNMSKFIVEFAGTLVISVFYFMIGKK